MGEQQAYLCAKEPVMRRSAAAFLARRPSPLTSQRLEGLEPVRAAARDVMLAIDAKFAAVCRVVSVPSRVASASEPSHVTYGSRSAAATAAAAALLGCDLPVRSATGAQRAESVRQSWLQAARGSCPSVMQTLGGAATAPEPDPPPADPTQPAGWSPRRHRALITAGSAEAPFRLLADPDRVIGARWQWRKLPPAPRSWWLQQPLAAAGCALPQSHGGSCAASWPCSGGAMSVRAGRDSTAVAPTSSQPDGGGGGGGFGGGGGGAEDGPRLVSPGRPGPGLRRPGTAGVSARTGSQ